MKSELFVGLLLWSAALPAPAQTNCGTDSILEFSLPPMQLRAELKFELPAPAAPSLPAGWGTQSETREATVSTADADTSLHTYNIRSDRFYLVETLPRESDNAFVRGYNKVFDPEVYHLGKRTAVSCSVATAIKRKNPLCLLNPIFFNMSW